METKRNISQICFCLELITKKGFVNCGARWAFGQLLALKMCFKIFIYFSILFVLFFVFLGLYPWHTEVPRLEVESELPAYTTAAAMPDPSCISSLPHSSRQLWILNSLDKARDRACILMDASQIHFLLSHDSKNQCYFNKFNEIYFIYSSNIGL